MSISDLFNEEQDAKQRLGEIAKPGDIVFLINRLEEYLTDSKAKFMQKVRTILGSYDPDGETGYHAGIYVGNDENGQPLYIDARFLPKPEKTIQGVIMSDLPKGFPKKEEYRERIEILRTDLTDEQRSRIVEFAKQQLGKPFNGKALTGAAIFNKIGLPNLLDFFGSYYCFGLVRDSYAAAGVMIGNRFGGSNIIGPKLYNDFSLEVIASLSRVNEDWLVEYNPGRYSWIK